MRRIVLASLVAASSFIGFTATPKNVILFIGDGMSMPQRMVAEEFSRKIGNGSLSMNAMPSQAITRTCSANSLVTDSAAAATAIACGEKTNNGAIGVNTKGKAIESCAEAAKKAGLKVGICSTVTLTHATPSGFYGHRVSRGDIYGLALDLVRSDFDFFAGGGLDLHKGYERGLKKNKEFLEHGEAYEYAKKSGYHIISTREEFLSLKPGCGKILTRFTEGPLAEAISAKDYPNEPSVAEITKKAIEILDNEKGFFLMVEGGRIDWAGHSNDAATNLRDVLALDEAVSVAVEFQKKNPDTLVLVTGDHETGGLSMGFAGTGYALYVDRLKKQTMSVGTFEDRMRKLVRANKDLKLEDTYELMNEAFGFVFDENNKKSPMKITPEEEKDLRKAFDHDIQLHLHNIGENKKYDDEKRYLFGGACRLVMSHKAGLGWSSGAHTAMPVMTSAIGPGAENFAGFIENIHISNTIKSFYK